jgi:hypothetical protein
MSDFGPRMRNPLAIGCLAAMLALGLAPRGRAEGWVDGRIAGPFVCRADFPLEGMDGLLADLAQLQTDLRQVLGIAAPGERIEILLFRDQASYRAYLSQHLPQVPYRRALYVKLQGPGMVFAYRSRELEVDLRHECTHALLHAALPMVPLWLDEGLAEYFEVAPAERSFGNPHLSGVRWSVRLGMPPKLEALEGKRDLSEMGRTEYRNAWAWTHFMLHGSAEAHEELVAFLGDIQAGGAPGQLSQRLQRRLPNLQRCFSDHFKGWSR